MDTKAIRDIHSYLKQGAVTPQGQVHLHEVRHVVATYVACHEKEGEETDVRIEIRYNPEERAMSRYSCVVTDRRGRRKVGNPAPDPKGAISNVHWLGEWIE